MKAWMGSVSISYVDSGCFCPAVAMVKTSDSQSRLDFARFAQTCRNHPTGGCVLVQRDVRSVLVIVRQILTTEASQVLFIQRDDVIHQLTANTTDPAFRDSVLPRAPQTGSYRFDAASFQKPENLVTELRVAIKQDITKGAGQRESLSQLLDNPVCGRMFRAIEVQNSSSAVFNDKEAVERTKVQRGNRKEVEGGGNLAVVIQKRQPSFRLGLVRSAPDALQVA